MLPNKPPPPVAAGWAPKPKPVEAGADPKVNDIDILVAQQLFQPFDVFEKDLAGQNILSNLWDNASCLARVADRFLLQIPLSCRNVASLSRRQ